MANTFSGGNDVPSIQPSESLSPKLCECGCGQPAPIATRDNRAYGWVKGQPKRFVKGHHYVPTVDERFWSKVQKSEDPAACWLWVGTRYPNGYGQFWTGQHKIGAHRFSYELAHGPITERLWVCHSCDNPPCVNPAHLSLGSQLENMQDKVRKGRAATGERNGKHTHPERIQRGDAHWKRRLSK
jgi:hypothetical protein